MRKLLMVALVSFSLGWILHFPKKQTYYIPQRDTILITIDSIQKVIDTIEVTKTNIVKIYEKKEQSIIQYSPDSDYVFFSNFLRSRFDDDYSDATKAN